MKNIKKFGLILGVVTLALSISAFNLIEKPAPLQQDKKPVNLKVLPKNISHDELSEIMRGFNTALGVKCGFCHAPSASDPTHLDFASDANFKKDVARKMIKMTNKINKKYFTRVDKEGNMNGISCQSCHNGKEEPATIILKKK